ncbi:uncharacterized protein si:ch211-136m16.8 [Labrus mixtus]|uniref:uncharacterized protein si:ch211-136m16.8 n=1 Tax=Labrus mixtus TaxID=508554 RepID=UPI0029C01B8C|nr:uncharacterized protein si:ch211-136m16.8 [Labrus mixtus]
MDPESPVVGRVERTFWTVWYYLTGAVNRLLRPEPANIVSNGPNSPQESAVDSELAKCSHLEDEVTRREVDEEQLIAPASLVGTSQSAVAWELCTTDIDLGPDVETMQYKSEREDSVEEEDTRGEELKQTECDDLELLVVKDEKEHEEVDRKLYTPRQDETAENNDYDERVNARSQMLKSDATSEDLAVSEGESEREIKSDVPQKMEETETKIQDKVGDNEHDLEVDGIAIKSCSVTEFSPEKREPKIHIEEDDMQKNETETLMKHEEVENSQGVLCTVQDEKQLSASEKLSNDELLIALVVGKDRVMAPRNMSNTSEDVKEKEDKSTMEEREQEAVIEEQKVNAAEENQALDKVLEQKDNSETVPEDSKEDPHSNDQKSFSDEVVLSAKTELHTNGEQEDVAKEVNLQIKMRDTDDDALITERFGDKPSDISVVDERSLDKDQVQEDIEESWGVRACTAISVTVKPEGETGQEESWEFQNIPQGIFEGRSDVSPELNPPTCEEAQEGVPDYNNEPGPDENTTQRFLEVGDSKEVQSSQLPKEVESKEPESLQNSGRSTGADCLLVQEHMEEVQESKEDIKRHSALVCAELPKETGKPLVEPTAQEPGPLFVEEDGTFMVAQMKTGIEQSENELETGLSVTKKKDLPDEELLVEIDEGSFNSKEADAAGDCLEATEHLVGEEILKPLEAKEQMTTETRFQESVDAKKTEQSSNRASGVQDDIPPIGFVKQSVETELSSNKETELQDTGNNLELEEYKVEEEEAAEVQMQNKNEVEILDLQVAGMAAEITRENNDLISEFTLSMKSIETENRLSDNEATHESEIIEPKPIHDVCMISTDEMHLGKDQVQEDIEESWGVRACTAISATVKPEGETGQEESWEFQNIPQGIFEGRSDVSPELNPPTCEEAQEGVPEYNNEPGPDENTTQRFLEVGDSKEVQSSQLPKEVESKEPESLQNSGRSTGADCLLVQEHMEEVQESKEDIKRHSALVCAELPKETGKPLVEPTAQEPGPLFVEEDGTFMVAQMKTGIEQSENELETGLSVTKKEDLPDEELLVEIDEGSFNSKEADAAVDCLEATEHLVGEEILKPLEAKEQMTTETRFQESVDAKKTEQSSNRASGVQDDIPPIGFVKQSVETELSSNKETELQDTGNNLELEEYKVEEEEAAEVQMQNKNEVEILDLQVAGMAAEITRENNDLISEFTLSMKSIETESRLSDNEATHESEIIEPKPIHDVCMISTDEMQKQMMESEGSCGPSQDVIDEEILDMWIETLSEDDEKHQEGLELGPQLNPGIEPSEKEETQQDTEQLVESNPGECELVSDTEMSSSTAESGFSDHSLNEWGPQNSETQLLKSASPGTVQGTCDMLVNVSESGNILELSPREHNSGSQDTMMEETPDARQLYLKIEESVTGFHLEERDSEEVRHQDQESDQTREKMHEENGLQKEIDGKVTDFKTAVEADVTSLTEVGALFQLEKTKVETETLEITASDSQEEIQHTDSARSRRDSEGSSEEGIESSESGSEDNTSTQSEKTLLEKKQLGLTEEIDGSLPGLTGTEVAQQSGDQIEVDASVLDFSAQRSRIAVKNPRVRPPTDPRSLLHMPSVDPTPASRLPVKVPAGVPLGGFGIGVKLPGLGAGFPVLKKTKQMMRNENSPDSDPQEPETMPEEKGVAPEEDKAQHKPKWMPPRHPGFGNPLMSELKTKLKKTTKE